MDARPKLALAWIVLYWNNHTKSFLPQAHPFSAVNFPTRTGTVWTVMGPGTKQL